MNPRKKLLFTTITAVLVLAVLEALGAAGTWLLARRGIMAYLPDPSAGQVEAGLASLDGHLGWGPETDAQGRVRTPQPRGGRSAAVVGSACASAYGDSFTWGAEVEPGDAYPARLAELLACPVANYGVQGYGSDQALLLFRAQAGADGAPVAVLGHLSENILRNVNQYRNLLYPAPPNHLAFKPRFLEEGDTLRALPPPVRTGAEFHGLRESPQSALPHDAFASRPRRSFPYTLALLRWLAGDYHLHALLSGTPRYAAFYRPDHPSGALPLTERILAGFAEEAAAAGRAPHVLLIPTSHDLAHFRATGEWPDQPLANALRTRGVPVIHAGPEILRRAGEGVDPCALYVRCEGHFSPAGNRLLAGIVADAVRRDLPRFSPGGGRPGSAPRR